MFRLVALTVLVAVATAAPFTFDSQLDVHWQNFKETFGKVYEPQEEMFR